MASTYSENKQERMDPTKKRRIRGRRSNILITSMTKLAFYSGLALVVVLAMNGAAYSACDAISETLFNAGKCLDPVINLFDLPDLKLNFAMPLIKDGDPPIRPIQYIIIKAAETNEIETKILSSIKDGTSYHYVIDRSGEIYPVFVKVKRENEEAYLAISDACDEPGCRNYHGMEYQDIESRAVHIIIENKGVECGSKKTEENALGDEVQFCPHGCAPVDDESACIQHGSSTYGDDELGNNGQRCQTATHLCFEIYEDPVLMALADLIQEIAKRNTVRARQAESIKPGAGDNYFRMSTNEDYLRTYIISPEQYHSEAQNVGPWFDWSTLYNDLISRAIDMGINDDTQSAVASAATPSTTSSRATERSADILRCIENGGGENECDRSQSYRTCVNNRIQSPFHCHCVWISGENPRCPAFTKSS